MRSANQGNYLYSYMLNIRRTICRQNVWLKKLWWAIKWMNVCWLHLLSLDFFLESSVSTSVFNKAEKKTSSSRHSALSFCSKYDMITKVILGRRRRAISEMQISVTVEPYITIVFRCLWLNFRISSHLFASRWVTNMPIFVICLVVEKVPTSGGVFWSWDLFPSVTIKSAKIKPGMYIWKS